MHAAKSSLAAVLCTRRFGAALALLVAGLPAMAAAKGLTVGEHRRDRVFETPHPYPGAAAGTEQPAWVDRIVYAEASHVVIEFARFALAPGDRVEVSDPARTRVEVLHGDGRGGRGGGFITRMVPGPEAEVRLYSTHAEVRHYGYRIERVTRGFSPRELERLHGPGPAPEAICGGDDLRDARCFEDSFPEVYARARAVARVIMDGSVLCTAWLISCQNHLLTNNHCSFDDDDFDSQAELDRMEFQFLYERPGCGSGAAAVEHSFLGGTWLENDRDLDYTLFQAPAGEDPASVYGWLTVDDRVPAIDEPIYIVGHPSGSPKQISLESTHLQDQSGTCEVFSLDEPACIGGALGEIGYHCDTQGGSSGSPVLSRVTQEVVALHHCADCPNRGVPIAAVWAALQSGPNALPACAASGLAGEIRLDRAAYRCSDRIAIAVSDASIAGAGSQAVDIASDSEPAGETVFLAETPPGSARFLGELAAAPAAPLRGDGRLAVRDGDRVTAVYVDADDGQGGVDVPRLDTAAIDCVGPVISDVRARAEGRSAWIDWRTDTAADSAVSYDVVTPPVAGAASDPSPVTEHTLVLMDLAECTTYAFAVRSADEAGNEAGDDNAGSYHRFTTGREDRPMHPAVDTPVPIPDVSLAFSALALADPRPLADLDVSVDLEHTYDGDLVLTLVAPDGRRVLLADRVGGSGEDFAGTVFDDEADRPIAAGSAPFAGAFRPEEPLSVLDGMSAAGTWTLEVGDQASADIGSIDGWALTFTFRSSCGPTRAPEVSATSASALTAVRAGDRASIRFEDVGSSSYNLYVSKAKDTAPMRVGDPAEGRLDCGLDGLVPAGSGRLELGGHDLEAGLAGPVSVLYFLVSADNGPGTEGPLGPGRSADQDCGR